MAGFVAQELVWDKGFRLRSREISLLMLGMPMLSFLIWANTTFLAMQQPPPPLLLLLSPGVVVAVERGNWNSVKFRTVHGLRHEP